MTGSKPIEDVLLDRSSITALPLSSTRSLLNRNAEITAEVPQLVKE